MHDATLKALVDELVVVRIVRRLTGRQAPQLQIQQWQQARVTTLREGIAQPDRALECGEESNRVTIDCVRAILADEVDCFGRVRRVTRQWRGGDQVGIRRRHTAAVEVGERHKPTLEQIQLTDTLAATLLHRRTLKQLRGAAEEEKVATDRIAKGTHTAALLKEVPERIKADTELGLGEEAWVAGAGGCGRCARLRARGGPTHAIGDDYPVRLIGEFHALVWCRTKGKRAKRQPGATILALIDAHGDAARRTRNGVSRIAGAIWTTCPARRDFVGARRCAARERPADAARPITGDAVVVSVAEKPRTGRYRRPGARDLHACSAVVDNQLLGTCPRRDRQCGEQGQHRG